MKSIDRNTLITRPEIALNRVDSPSQLRLGHMVPLAWQREKTKVFYCVNELKRIHWKNNAAPEWQARCLGWLSRVLVVACPLEGIVGLSRCAADSNPL